MTALESILSQQIVQRLGWTLLHFLWQAAATALLLAIVLAALRKSAANLRYIIACLALGLVVLLPIVTMCFVPVSTPQPTAGIGPAPAPVILPTEPTGQIPAAEMTVVEAPQQQQDTDADSVALWKQRIVESVEPALPFIVSGWLLGVFGLSVWHLGGWAQLQRLRSKMVRQVNGSLNAKLSKLSARLGVRRAVQLLESALVQVPTVVGWVRPVILLPASALTGLNTEQLEALLAHELAHIRRHDYLLNMLQTVVETLGFYHPAVWWISHKIRAERENCCDDLAVSVSGDRVRYARALTSMEEIRSSRGKLAVAATGGSLFGRIRRLVGKDSAEPGRTSWIPSVVTILLIAVIAIPATLALTGQSEDKAATSLETALSDGFRANRDMFKRGALAWTLTDRNEGLSEGPRTETRGTFQLWWDGKKIATRFSQVRTDLDAEAVIDQRTGGNAYDGSIFSRKPRFEANENWFEQVINWTGPRAIDQEIPALRKRSNIATDLATVLVDGRELLKLTCKNTDTAAVDYGAYTVRYFDSSRGYGLVNEEWYNADERPRLRFSYKLRQVIPDGWFPIDVDISAFSLKDGKVYLRRHLALDLERCSFNDPSAIPDGVFDFSAAKEHEQLNDILHKLSQGANAGRADENVQSVCKSVEGYVAAALAGDDKKAAEYAYPEREAAAETKDMREALQGQNMRIFGVCIGEWNAMAISSVIQADHGRTGSIVFHLEKLILDQKVNWLIDDIDLETLDSIEAEIKRFLERNPQAKTTTFKPQRPVIKPERDDGERTIDMENPKNLHDSTLEAGLAIESENYRLAQIFAERAVQSKPDSADGWLFLGMASIKMNDYDRARQSYERALALYRDADDIGQQEFVLRLLGRDTEAGKLQSQAGNQADSKDSSPSMPGYYGYVAMKLAEFILPAEKQSNTTAVQDEDKEDWGQAAEGAQIRLLDAAQIWGRSDWPHTVVRLRLDARNEGARYLHLPENGLCWQIEVDGVWYEWVDPQRYIAPRDRDQTALSSGSRLLDFNPGNAHSKLMVDIASDWWQIPDEKQDEYGRRRWTGWAGIDDEYGPELILQPGPHRLRVAVTCPRSRAGSNRPVRLLSNPVEMEILPSANQSNVPVEDDSLLEALRPEEAPPDSPPAPPVMAMSPAPTADDKAHIRVDCLVVEVAPDSKLDSQTAIEAEKLLGKKMAAGEPAIVALLNRASEATAAEDTPSEGKRLTPEQFKTLIDTLVSKGYLKILMNPTLEVVDGQTAKIMSSQHIRSTQDALEDSIQITPHVTEDGNIDLQVQAVIHQKSPPQAETQTPAITSTHISTQARVRPGMSLIVGGIRKEQSSNAEDSGQRPTELLVILTSTITKAAAASEARETPSNQFVKIYALQHTGCRQLAESLVSLLPDGKKVQISADEQVNRLIVQASKADHERIAELILQLDVAPVEIQIETRILTVSDEFLDGIGLDANSVSDPNAWPEPAPRVVTDSNDLRTRSLLLDDQHVSFLIRAAQAHKDAKMLAAPRVLVRDGEEAQIEISTAFGYISGYGEPNRPGGEPVPKLESARQGTLLSMTPRVIPDKKYVDLDFEWEIRRLHGLEERMYKDKYPYQIPNVTVVRRRMRAWIPEGATLLMSGQRITGKVTSKSSVPLLGRLPLIGEALFTREQVVSDRRMLLMLVKPTIVPPGQAEKHLAPPLPPGMGIPAPVPGSYGGYGSGPPPGPAGYGGYGSGPLPSPGAPGYGGYGPIVPPAEPNKQ